MVRRNADKPVCDYVDEGERQPVDLERNLDHICWRRFSLSDRQHTHRDERAILTAIAFLSVRTALHVIGHSGHIAHLANRQSLRRNRVYQRRSNEPHDYKNRKQTTDKSANIHNPTSHRSGNLGRTITSHSC